MFIVSVHSCEGSMGEAVSPIVAFLVDLEEDAKTLAVKLQNTCGRVVPDYDLLATYFQIDAEDQTTDTDELIRLAEAAIGERFS